MILLVFGGMALLRLLPQPKSRAPAQPEREALEQLQARLGQLDQLQERMSELEERVDFTERLLTKQRQDERSALPPE
jgi:predicted nuclease with TOPRIM domain